MIGASRADWQRVKLNDLGTVVTGRTPPTSDRLLFGDVYPFITPTDIKNNERYNTTERYLSEHGRHYMRKALLPPDSTCFVCIGATIGKICMTKEISFSNQQINTVIPNPKNFDSFFVYYALRNLAPDVASLAAGAATPIINKSRFSELTIRVPALFLQRRIGSILSAYDDLIENNTRRIAILEEMARALYQEWFVRFRFPGHEHVPLVDSPLGPIPEEWEARGLYEIADVTYGFPFKSKLFNSDGNGAAVIRIRDIRSDKASAHTPEPAPAKCLVKNGDILIGMDGEFHMGRWAGGEAVLNQRVARLRPKDDIDILYLFYAVEPPIKHLEQTIVGTTVAHLSAHDLKQMKIVVPAPNIRAGIARIFVPIHEAVLNLKLKNSNLRTTRDLLLPKLISGEIDVSALTEGPIAEAAD